MPYGYAPFIAPLDTLVRRRLRLNGMGGPETGPWSPDLGQAEQGFASAPQMAPAADMGPTGADYGAALPEALAAGAAAGQGTQGFGKGFIAGLSAGIGASAAGGRARAKSRQDQAGADFEKQLKTESMGLERRRVSAEEAKAYAPDWHPQTQGQQLQDQITNLRGLGATDKDILEALLAHESGRGRGGAGGGAAWHGTDRERLAESLVKQGRAKNMDEGRIMATTLLQRPQVVGQIERFVEDPDNPYNFKRARFNVFSHSDPLTGETSLVDEAGNVLTEEDIQRLKMGVKGGSGGKVGPVGTVPTHLPDSQKPTAASFDKG